MQNHPLADTRREFIKNAGLLLASLILAPDTPGSTAQETQDPLGMILPKRKLGNTGESVTMLGLGGYHIGCFMSEPEAERTIRTALEQGVRFFDCSQAYCNGECERRLGKFLPSEHRDKYYLMTKTRAFDAKTAQEHLETSLRQLKVEYLDLWQMHNLFSLENLDLRIKNGVLDVLQEAKRSGKVRHIGFTGHANPAIHCKMLEETDLFDTCQMPLNVFDPNYLSFGTNVLPELIKRDMGVIVIKSLGGGSFFSQPELLANWSVQDPVIPAHISIRQALYYVWSLPVSVIVTGADDSHMLMEKIQLARTFTPYSRTEIMELVQLVADMAGIAESNYKTETI